MGPAPAGNPPSPEHQVKITDGRGEAQIAPQGGCLTAFRWPSAAGPVDWLRPAAASGQVAPVDSACFPLVPYSNRIRDGRFAFEGRDYHLARNFGASPHSIHGHGWQAPWHIAAQEEDRVTLVFTHEAVYTHEAADWPSPYRAEQRFSLSEGVLTIDLGVTNTGPRAMPIGLGLHPYFPRTPRCRLTAAVEGMWKTDAEVMPTTLIKADLSGGLEPEASALDNCFTGFAGEAVIDWPERHARLTITADPALSFLVVFTPPGEDFFCVEPVTHSTDAVNLAGDRGDTGLKILQPGETFAASIRFAPQLDAAR